jgi:hypothetical protein
MQRAPDLARDAEGETSLGAHRDALDEASIVQVEHELVGVSVGGGSLLSDLGQPEVHELCQLLAQNEREAGHGLGATFVFLVDPTEEL